MSISALELRLTQGGAIVQNGYVAFNEDVLVPPGIEYEKTTGIVTFQATGQYAIQWWIATETTLKGAIGFHLVSPGRFTPGCSPIKTGQVTGFGVIDVDQPGITLGLMNKSDTNTVISRKAGTKGYLLITPLSPPSLRVYRGDLSVVGNSIQAPLGNGLYYRIQRLNTSTTQLVLVPMNGTTRYDYRRLSSFDGGTGFEGNYLDNTELTTSTVVDTPIYNNSREMHWVLLRVQNPVSSLWSTYEVRFFLSNAGARGTVWVNVIEEEVSY